MTKIFHTVSLLIICCVALIPAFAQADLTPGTFGKIDEGRRIRDDMEKRERERKEEIKVYPRPRPINLDKGSRKELKDIQRVDDQYRTEFAALLGRNNTGIFKLFPDNGCEEKYLVRAGGDCEGFVPDSSFYTFRTGSYGTRAYKNPPAGDLGYFKGNFVSRRYFTQPIMVPLGDVPIESVTDTHPAVKLLVDFKPHLTPASAEKAAKILARGSNADGYRFAADAPVTVGQTYAFRQIAFNMSGEEPKVKVPSIWGPIEIGFFKRALKYQERKDTVFIFRVLRQDEDGGTTIVWKQLSRKDAPAIVFQKGDTIPILNF